MTEGPLVLRLVLPYRQHAAAPEDEAAVPDYSTLRMVLGRRFTRDSLHAAVRVAHAIARTPHLTNPAVPLTIALALERVANRWFDGEPTEEDTAVQLEQDLLTALLKLLDAAEGPSEPGRIVTALNQFSRACTRSVEWLG